MEVEHGVNAVCVEEGVLTQPKIAAFYLVGLVQQG